MKILSSSPYSTFRADEWRLSTKSFSSVDPLTPAKIKKKYYKNFVKFEIEEAFVKNISKPEAIQLSFA
tara:strand:+ start:593 stop:796 length:204 start_codon:yes stop_codon:yes gene_type:complete